MSNLRSHNKNINNMANKAIPGSMSSTAIRGSSAQPFNYYSGNSGMSRLNSYLNVNNTTDYNNGNDLTNMRQKFSSYNSLVGNGDNNQMNNYNNYLYTNYDTGGGGGVGSNPYDQVNNHNSHSNQTRNTPYIPNNNMDVINSHLRSNSPNLIHMVPSTPTPSLNLRPSTSASTTSNYNLNHQQRGISPMSSANTVPFQAHIASTNNLLMLQQQQQQQQQLQNQLSANYLPNSNSNYHLQQYQQNYIPSFLMQSKSKI